MKTGTLKFAEIGPAANNAPIKLSWAKAPLNQFRKCIGTYLHRDGKPRKKIFWLGRDHDTAVHTARCLLLAWAYRSIYGLEHWTPELEKMAMETAAEEQNYAHLVAANVADQLAKVRSLGIPLPAKSEAAAIAPAPAEPVRVVGKTLGEAVKTHLLYLEGRQLSKKYLGRTAAAFKQMHEILPQSMTLAAIDKNALLKFTAHFMARPTSKVTGGAMAVDSIRTLFTEVKRLFESIDGDGWEGPKKWQKLFNVRWASLRTPQEQKKAAKGKDVFTTAELVDLYRVANDRTKMFILLGLNCGMAQKEISTLLADDIDFKAGVIDRIRNKTRGIAAVRGCWSLWPETAELINAHLAKKNADGLAFLTEDGNPLVNDETDTDSIALAWARLHKTAKREAKKVRPLPFGTLRKTGSTWLLNHGGEAVQELHLAHAGRSVARKHYTGQIDFSELHQKLAAYRMELVAAGMFETTGQNQERADVIAVA